MAWTDDDPGGVRALLTQLRAQQDAAAPASSTPTAEHRSAPQRPWAKSAPKRPAYLRHLDEAASDTPYDPWKPHLETHGVASHAMPSASAATSASIPPQAVPASLRTMPYEQAVKRIQHLTQDDAFVRAYRQLCDAQDVLEDQLARERADIVGAHGPMYVRTKLTAAVAAHKRSRRNGHGMRSSAGTIMLQSSSGNWSSWACHASTKRTTLASSRCSVVLGTSSRRVSRPPLHACRARCESRGQSPPWPLHALDGGTLRHGPPPLFDSMWLVSAGLTLVLFLCTWPLSLWQQSAWRAPAQALGTQEAETDWLRLPRDVRPKHYDLTMLTDLTQTHFYGAVNVSLDVLEDTKMLTFNAGRDMDVSSVLVETPLGTFILPPERDIQHERISVSIPIVLRRGMHVSILTGFHGPITMNMVGYYYATWSHQGEHGNYTLTQFEPTAARDGFPCWDEPDLKATFRMRMLHADGTTALNNMPSTHTRALRDKEVRQLLHMHELRYETPSWGSQQWHLTEFEKTPRMSTYLVAYGNGHLWYVEDSFASAISGRTVPVRIYTTPEFIEKAYDALKAMKEVVPVLENMFDIEYPLPKLDMLVAVGFDSDAMENWGLITGRATTFLTDENSSLENRQYNAMVMAHECAHMWFGDIATMTWWDNLWLNEAFATLVGEVMATSQLYPTWHMDRRFLLTEWNRALDLDAKRASHPIELPVEGDDIGAAVSQVFDAISYAKGASVLRMLSKTLGDDVFIKGVSLYLKKHLYGNTETRDLWDGLSKAAGKNVSEIMEAWINRQGFPVLTVTEGKHSILVTQNRFLETGVPKSHEDETLWHIPLALKVIRDGKETIDTELMLPAQRTIEIPLPHAHHVVWKLNADSIGAYRVAYSPSHLRKLGEAKDLLSVEDRIGLLSDAMRLAQAGYVRTSHALELMLSMKDDPNAIVQAALHENVAALASVLWEQPAELQEALQRFGRDLFSSMAQHLTLTYEDDDSVATRSLRTNVVDAAATVNDPWTIGQMEKEFERMYKDRHVHGIHPDLQRIVLIQGVRHGGERAYEVVRRMFYESPDPEDQKSAMLALCYAQEPRLLQRTVDMVFSDDTPKQNLLYAVTALASNTKARRLVWHAMKVHFDEIVDVFTGNIAFIRLIIAAVSSFTSEKDAADVEQFFHGLPTERIDRGVSQGLESIRAQARWVSRDVDDVQQWLRQHNYMA